MDCALYFTRLAVNEDKQYYPLPAAFHDEFKREAMHVPAVRDVLDDYAALCGADLLALFEATLQPGEDPYRARLCQAGLAVCVAHYLHARHDLSVKAVGSYSNGVSPAFLFTSAVGVRDFITKVSPFHHAVWAEMGEKGAANDLAQVLIEGGPDDDVEGFVAKAIAASDLLGTVFMKDRRQHHTVLVAGLTSAVETLLGQVITRFPIVSRRRPRAFPHRFASHLPYLDVDKVRSALSVEGFGRSRYPIVGIQGRVTTADAGPEELRRTYCNGVTGAMDTGRALQRLFAYSPRVLVIGSVHGARVLAGLRWPPGASIELGVEALTGLPGAVREGTVYGGPFEKYLG